MKDRPELTDLFEAQGSLKWIFKEIHGIENPRIVVESKNKEYYEVVFQQGSKEVLDGIAQALGLVVTKEQREIKAITIRVSREGRRLTPSKSAKPFDAEAVGCDENGRWPLEAITLDELARFLEKRYRKPVVNLTALQGRWSILLSGVAGRTGPDEGTKAKLDDLGLELQWENVKMLVTVVKDKDSK